MWNSDNQLLTQTVHMAADPPSKPTDSGYKSTCRLLSYTLTVAIFFTRRVSLKAWFDVSRESTAIWREHVSVRRQFSRHFQLQITTLDVSVSALTHGRV